MPVRANKGVPVEKTYPTVAALTPSSTTNFALDVTSLIEEVRFRFTASCVLAGCGAAPTLRAESLENFFSSIQFLGNAKVNGADAVQFSNVDASYLRFKESLIRNTLPKRTNMGTANATFAVESNFTKFFSGKGLKNISDAFFLDTRKLQSLNVAFTTRDIGAFVDPATLDGGTLTVNTPQVSVHTVGWQGGQIATGAPYIKEVTRKFSLANLTGLAVPFLNMPVSNIITRQTFKATSGNTDYADPTDATFSSPQPAGAIIATKVTGAGGDKTPLSMSYAHMQAYDKVRAKLENWPVGYATYAYSRTGLLEDALSMKGIITGENDIDIVPPGGGATNTLYITDEQVVANN